MITEKEILQTNFRKAKKPTWTWSDDYYLEEINPEYGFFLKATLHVPTEIWRNSSNTRMEDNFSIIILHRVYDIEDPTKYWDWAREEGESREVYRGLIRNKKHLEQLTRDLGII